MYAPITITLHEDDKDHNKVTIQPADWSNAKIGDIVSRLFAPFSPDDLAGMTLKITGLTDDLIICSAWQFSRETGAEIDDMLGWTKYDTGSIIFKHTPK